LRVLYDVSSLGFGFQAGVGRAGIFRVCDRFVREVLTRPELRPTFASLPSYWGRVQVARYDRSADGMLGEDLVAAWDHSATTLQESIDLVDRIVRLGEASPEGKKAMAAMMLLNRTAREVPLPDRYDIYHSLCHPLAPPGRVRAGARLLLVHDLVPFLFPELCMESFAPALAEIIASVDLDRDWVVCNSECTRRDFCERTSMDPERVFVTPLAADNEVFYPERDPERIASTLEKYRIPDHPYVLSLCTIEPRKNLAHLIRCFFALASEQSCEDLRLVLVGATGWQSEEVFETLKANPALERRVILTGQVPDADLSALYGGAKLFVYPSLYEGFGLPVLEAMQCGVPVIASNAGALPEVVGEAGILIDPHDADALCQAILDVLHNPRLASDGLARAQEFSWQRTVDLTTAAYRTMLA